AAIGADTTLAIVNTPVNPTGYVFRRHDLDAIASAVADTEALLVSDEAYFGLTYDGLEHLSPASHPDLRDRTVVLRSFSKTHALPEGAAFVWAAVDGDEDEWSDRLAREHGITALPGRHFHARTPHLRIPFGGRREAREQLLLRLAGLGAATIER